MVYWMSRDMRSRDNWALLFAQEQAVARKAPLAVVFCLVPTFLGACLRQYDFMLRGLEEVEAALNALKIPFFLLKGDPGREIPRFLAAHGTGLLVHDFDPLRVKREWKRVVAGEVKADVCEVDAHNVVPCTFASPKQELGARTLRPKLRRFLPDFLTEFPAPVRHPYPWPGRTPKTDWPGARSYLRVDTSVGPVDWRMPGEKRAREALDHFIDEGLDRYDEARNHPATRGQSGLSPYLHFGHLSAQRVALEVTRAKAAGQARDTFLDELIIRRELSDNYCLYNPHYDGFRGFPLWAQRTLDEHRQDRRPALYSLEELEVGATCDEVWNAAQMEMVRAGKMHGYMRMYWAKKILEWSASPEEALERAIYLNDRYELDGRDPNGYAGIAWSIGGVHDRAWPSRPVFGNVRFMSYNGIKSKIDVKAYIGYVAALGP